VCLGLQSLFSSSWLLPVPLWSSLYGDWQARTSINNLRLTPLAIAMIQDASEANSDWRISFIHE
jgi:hypothetical protein